MLCKLLSATNVAGRPGSHFHQPSIEAWLKHYGLKSKSFASEQDALEAIFAAAIAMGRGETNVFGLRIQRKSFQFFMEKLELLYPGGSTDRERMEAAFGPTLFIHLWRENHLDQAISRLRAEQTGVWHRNSDGTDLERKEPSREPGYDQSAIQTYLQEAREQNEQWSRWFDEQSITPLKIAYDDLARDPRSVLVQILAELDLETSLASTVPIETAKLANETNRTWRHRFEAEAKGLT